MNGFGARLFDLRKGLKLSQAEFAEKLGLDSSSAIAIWESGVCFPDVRALQKLAEVFDCDLHELLTSVVSPAIATEVESLRGIKHGLRLLRGEIDTKTKSLRAISRDLDAAEKIIKKAVKKFSKKMPEAALRAEAEVCLHANRKAIEDFEFYLETKVPVMQRDVLNSLFKELSVELRESSETGLTGEVTADADMGDGYRGALKQVVGIQRETLSPLLPALRFAVLKASALGLPDREAEYKNECVRDEAMNVFFEVANGLSTDQLVSFVSGRKENIEAVRRLISSATVQAAV